MISSRGVAMDWMLGGLDSYWDLVLSRALGLAPLLLASIVGLVVSVIRGVKHRRAGVLASVAFGVLVLAGVASVFGMSWLQWRAWTGYEDPVRLNRVMGYAGMGLSVLEALALVVLVVAVFAGRAGGARGLDQAAGGPGVSEGAAARPASPPVSPGELGAYGGVPPPTTRISKGVFIASIFGSFIFTWVLMIPGVVLAVGGDEDLIPVALGLVCVGYLPLIYAMVMIAVLIYKLWATIRDGDVRATPGQAVGFCFIPFFNFYWIFQAYRGWAVDFNRYVHERGIAATRAPEGVALTVCVFALLSIIPYLGMLVALANVVLLWVFFSRAIDGANAVRAWRVSAIAAA